MNSDKSNSEVPAEGETLPVKHQPGSDVLARPGHLPPSETIEADERVSIAREEGYDSLAISLALQPPETAFWERAPLFVAVCFVAALVYWFFPTERFFKPPTEYLGDMTIGAPFIVDNPNKEQWANVLSEIDQLYSDEGKLTEAIRVAKSALEDVSEEDLEHWRNVYYRYFELLWDAGETRTLKAECSSFLEQLPEDPFANYYNAHAFLAEVEKIKPLSEEQEEDYRNKAEWVVSRVIKACNTIDAKRRYSKTKENEDVLIKRYQLLRLEEAKLYALIWELGGYQEDEHSDVDYRDDALNICDSAELKNRAEAIELKIKIYEKIIDRWWWLEGPQKIQGSPQQKKDLKKKVVELREDLKEIQKL